MQDRLLKYLCDPVDKSDLALVDPTYDSRGRVVRGTLVSTSGRSYPIRDGIPRFVEDDDRTAAVDSFGDQWNHFNFDAFRSNWLNHTVKNTFGAPDAFRGKVVVDAGAGSGMQSRWISESGADYVIALELSHAVDGVMRDNLEPTDNVDVVQCSIDAPPLHDGSVDGMVICHNVIQHTPSVEGTARALWKLVGPGGEFVFNCYPKNDLGWVRRARNRLHFALRGILSRRSFTFVLTYARIMSVLRFVPLLGTLLEKSNLMVRGDVVQGPDYLRRCYVAGVLNTFDCYGSHAYQHRKSDREIRELVEELQPDPAKVRNLHAYFSRPKPIGCALRLIR